MGGFCSVHFHHRVDIRSNNDDVCFHRVTLGDVMELRADYDNFFTSGSNHKPLFKMGSPFTVVPWLELTGCDAHFHSRVRHSLGSPTSESAVKMHHGRFVGNRR